MFALNDLLIAKNREFTSAMKMGKKHHELREIYNEIQEIYKKISTIKSKGGSRILQAV